MRTTRDLRSTSESSGSSEFVAQAAHAFQARAGVEEESDDRGIAAVAEVLAGVARQEQSDLIVSEHGNRLPGGSWAAAS